MKLSRALSDLVKYTRSVGLYDIEAQGEISHEFTLMTESDSKFIRLVLTVFWNERDEI